MAYVLQPEVTLPAEECHELLRAAVHLGLAPVASENYKQTSPSETKAFFQPHIGARFPGEWEMAFMVILFPGMSIPVHTDGIPEIFRRHVVLQTNDKVWCHHDGDWQQLPLGTAWSMDPMRPHGAVNWGKDPRIHLLIDIRR
jgi:hypothetical protein